MFKKRKRKKEKLDKLGLKLSVIIHYNICDVSIFRYLYWKTKQETK